MADRAGLLAARSLVWLTRIGVHSGYAAAVLGPLMLSGLGLGFTIAPTPRHDIHEGSHELRPCHR